MDDYRPPRYTVELWHRNDTKIADITHLVQNLRWSATRNGVETLDFAMSMTDWEEKCRRIGEDPQLMLKPWVADIKIKRNGQYLYGFVVVEVQGNFNESNRTVQVQCDGYLNLLDARFVTRTYSQVEATSIAWDVIQTAQSRTNGNMGITRGRMYQTGVRRDRSDWEDKNVKEAIVGLTNLIDGKFDFAFTHNRVFETFQSLGNERPDVVVRYPDDGLAIGAIRMEVPQSGANLYNSVTAKGSGMGDETIRHTAQRMASQQEFILREKVQLYNDIKVLATLTEHCEADVELMSRLIDLPRVTVRGRQFDLNSIGVGDRIVVEQTDNPAFALSGYYRIERIEVQTDENFAEEITLTLDNYGL